MTFQSHEGPVHKIAYSPDGRRLASIETIDNATGMRVWDLDTGEQPLVIPAGFTWNGLSFDLTFRDDGAVLGFTTWDIPTQRVMIHGYDVVSGKPVISHTLPVTMTEVTRALLSPDWTLLAVTHQNGEARLLDAETAEELVVFPAHADRVNVTRFSDDGTRLLVGSGDGAVSIWDVVASTRDGNPERLASFSTAAALAPGHELYEAEFDEDGSRVALAMGDGLVQLWELLPMPVLRHTLAGGQTGQIERLSFNADGSLLAAGGQDVTVAVWETEQGRLQYTLIGHQALVNDLTFSPNGQTLATGGADGTARIWDTNPASGGEIAHFVAGVQGIVMDLELNPNGRTLAIGSNAGPVVLLDAQTGTQVMVLGGEPGTGIYRVSFHPEGRHLATAGEDNTIRIWNLETGEIELAWSGHEEGNVGNLFDGTLAVAYSPDGTRLATAGADGLGKVWDAATGDELLVLAGHTDGLTNIAYSPDGRLIATSSDLEDQSVKVWDAQTGAEVYSLAGHPVRVWALAFSPDSRLLATGGFQGVVKLWDLDTGAEFFTLPSQVGTVASIRFTPDGERLITGGGDAVRVWDVTAGTELLTIANGSHTLELSGDGRQLYAVGGSLPSLRTFALPPEDLIALAYDRLSRWWTPEECLQYLHQETCPEKPPAVR
jgi:WD40 repeat protein